MNALKLTALGAIAVAAAAIAMPANAILIGNPGFEDGGPAGAYPGQPLPPTSAFPPLVTAPLTPLVWYRDNNRIGAGIYSPTTGGTGTAYNPGEFSGSNVLFNNDGSTQFVFQILADNLLEGTYTLTALIGNRRGEPFPGGSLRLFAGTTQLASTAFSGATIADGTFDTIAVTYTALAGNLSLGNPLQIRMYTSNNQVDMDDVALSGPNDSINRIIVPEPSILALFGIGLLALTLLARRRKSA